MFRNFRQRVECANTPPVKFIPHFAALSAALSLAACTSAPQLATLEHVATPGGSAQATQRGALVVYSAYEVGPPSPNDFDSDHRHHTDYEIRDQAGSLVTKVRNRASAFGENPATLPLPVGQYQLTARSNGFGYVVVPVTVVAARATILHLEDGGPPTRAPLPPEYDLVRVASGRVVGWAEITADRY